MDEVMDLLEIRPARSEEAASVAALVDVAYAKYIGRIGRKPAPMLADYPALIARGVVYVVSGAERLRAVLVMLRQRNHLFLENIAVHPDDQGRGFGRQLMAFVDQHARLLGLDTVELCTNELMTENLAFYPRLGFVEIDRRTEDGFQRVFMRKVLA
jgi:ribosomal protein S18 acetylase RimI-like enzyme